MIINSSELEKLKRDGFLLKKNVLELDKIKKIKEIIKLNDEGKGVPESYYPITIKAFITKLIKFDFLKIKHSLFF